MDVSLYIAKRIKFGGKMAMSCIAVSFIVIIIAVAVSGGFRHEIRNGLSDISGDVRIVPVNMSMIDEGSPIERHPAYLEHISKLDGVSSVSPVVYRAGIIKSGENIQGVLFKGTEKPDSSGSLGVSIPSKLASMLELKAGDDLLAYFVGERVKARKFKVESVYESMLDMEDKLVVYTGLNDLQRLNGWSEEEISAFEIMLDDGKRTVSGMEEMSDEIGFMTYNYADESEETVVAVSSVSMYPQLFDWLNLIDFNVLFILVLMTIVAGFNMISGLLIMLFENISTIGLLKSLGMTDKSIAKIFLAGASVIVFKGMAIGNLAAFALCGLQSLFHIIALNPDNYFVSFVPVHLNVLQVLLADVVVYVTIMILLLIPSLFIAKVDPVKTVAVR